MTKISSTALLAFLFLLSTSTYAQTTIILDTDFGGDADDIGALAMLNHFIDKKECTLKGVMCWSTEKDAVAAVDAVNRYYNHPNIPIGVRKDPIHTTDWNYSKSIADHFPHQLNYENVTDATVLYRKILSESPDKSIVIIVIGPLKNIENLINSQKDSLSNLSGKELIKKKVKEFVIMGGKYPQGDWEWNFEGGMPGVTKYVLSNLSTPITFSGYEIGVDIKTGEVFNQIDPNSPLYVGFMHFSKNAPWVKENFKGKILNNATYDQTAVLYAVRKGTGLYWDKVSGETCVPDEKGGNKWIKNKKSNHSYLVLKMDNEKIAKQIESFMLGTF
jgi:inosine-uridine nucleoside N-ribohydrolase